MVKARFKKNLKPIIMYAKPVFDTKNKFPYIIQSYRQLGQQVSIFFSIQLKY